MKLELGGGHMPMARDRGFLNVDIRKLPTVDIVADLTKRLPFKDKSIEEIYTSHLIEHLTEEQVQFLLNECYRILVPKRGKIFIRCPNLRLICERVLKEGISKVTAAYIFGGFKYDSDVHKSGYDFEHLKSFLEKAGFINIREKQPSECFDEGRHLKFSRTREMDLRVEAWKR